MLVIKSLFLLTVLFHCQVNAEENAFTSCQDSDPKCSAWAAQGECQTNAAWMMTNCRHSCHSCQGGDKAWKLRSLIAAAYSNSTQQNITRIVRVESLRITHVEMDEEKQYVRVYGRMVLSWNDSTVSWNREEWGLSWLNFYWIHIWTPQLIQINSASLNPGAVTNKVLAANYTGQVYLWNDFTFIAPYNFQYEDYPNDYQHVCFKFDDKRYFAVRFLVADEVKTKRREELSETHASGWTVVSVDVSDSKYVLQMLGDWKRDPYDIQATNCELCINLRRNAVYYVSEMLLPALVTSAMTVFSTIFQLSTIQSGLLGFSMVAQILSLELINNRLPAFAANQPTILKYAGFNLIITTLLFLLTLGLRKLSQLESDLPAPHWVEQFTSIVNRILRIPSAPTSSTVSSSVITSAILPPLSPTTATAATAAATASFEDIKNANVTRRCHYATFAHAVNNIMFAISLLTYFIAVVVSFVL